MISPRKVSTHFVTVEEVGRVTLASRARRPNKSSAPKEKRKRTDTLPSATSRSEVVRMNENAHRLQIIFATMIQNYSSLLFYLLQFSLWTNMWRKYVCQSRLIPTFSLRFSYAHCLSNSNTNLFNIEAHAEIYK